ncbi:MAG TPA: HNH endonuclease [Candidatus Hypogeohydataceae bacterium YC41]
MSALPPEQLVEAILEAIQESGDAGMLVSRIRTHPRQFLISKPTGETHSLWVYAWTLTHGGRPQLGNEYRIQMTSVSPPLRLNPDGPTVLIGYEPNLKMFAGFDLERHRTFTKGSSSVQIDITSIQKAVQDGLAFDRKANNEIAVAIRPDQFLNYAYDAKNLHKYGRVKSTLTLLSKATSLEPIESKDIAALTQQRRRLVQRVSLMSRSANFRLQVLNAYANRCAVSRAQLRLVDAAHILPVGAPASVDHVFNGIALSPTFHRAFDNALIYLDEHYMMRLNQEKESLLIRDKLDCGLTSFKTALGKVHLPPDRRQWPDPYFIKKANEFRRIR